MNNKKTTIAPEANGAPTGQNRAISVRGARVHNLKNISIDIPRNKLVVVTGVSGSGKSSLAFDTVYAEGQRRFVESLSAYARQFLERMNKPEVDLITGIPPAIAIEQKTVTRNPRSTVGTTTEVYDYLRLLFGRIGKTYCKNCGSLVRKDTPQSALESISGWSEGDRLYMLFPLRTHRESTLAEELENIRGQGFFRIVVGASNDVVDLNDAEVPASTSKEDIFILIDRVVLRKGEAETTTRMTDSLETAFREGDGRCVVRNITNGEELHFSSRYECAACRIIYQEPQPRLFSFNNPFGACPQCQGFGRSIGIDENLIFPDRRRSIRQGAIHPFQTPSHSQYLRDLIKVARAHSVPLDTPLESLTAEQMSFVMEGGDGYIGVNGFFRMLEEKSYKMHYRVLMSRYRGYTRCSACKGSRLRTSARQVFVGGKNIADVVMMNLEDGLAFIGGLQLSDFEEAVAGRIVAEIHKRMQLLVDIGIGYLTLDRLSHTLSGGESQRINLATSIGSSLVGALYVLDEPSIGLHPRDTERMIGILHKLRNLGNSVIVVEHDADIIRRADQVIDIGPRAGELGGEVIFQGTYSEMLADKHSLTGKYLSGKQSIPVPKERNAGNGKKIIVRRPTENNLKGDDVEIPLGCMTVVTGVSGSGKSTFVHDVLYSALQRMQGQQASKAGRYGDIEGADNISMVEMVDQSPIGKSPRSTPATYTKAFDVIREVFASTQAAKQLGWKPGHFSFNVPGGRCETCQGEGMVKIEMQFLADLFLECEDCKGTRYKKEAQSILYDGKSIVDVLNMTVDEAIAFFAGEKKVQKRLKVLKDVGLGYMRLGQPGNTLSGGEAQRIKLASHLQVTSSDPILFIFDEPTTGLHFDDISKLLGCFRALVRKGHSLLIVEHNLDVIKSADWIIDLGPEAGDRGGYVVAAGTPEKVASVKKSYTGRFLVDLLPPKEKPAAKAKNGAKESAEPKAPAKAKATKSKASANGAKANGTDELAQESEAANGTATATRRTRRAKPSEN